MNRSLIQLRKLAIGRPSAFAARTITGRQLPIALATSSNINSLWGQQQFKFKSTAATAAFDQTIESFPSIVIGPNGSIIPQGTFAEAQAEVRYYYFQNLLIILFIVAGICDAHSFSSY